VVPHKRLELGHEQGVPADREVGFDSQVERRETNLVQPRDRALGERLVGEVGKRCATPQDKRLAQEVRRALRLPARQCVGRLFGESLEPVQVELLGVTWMT
jgi:hypothetical protein